MDRRNRPFDGKAYFQFRIDLELGSYEGAIQVEALGLGSAEVKIAFEVKEVLNSGTLQTCSHRRCDVKYDYKSRTFDIRAENGTKVNVGGSMATVANGKATVRLDLWKAAVGLNPRHLKDVEIPITLTTPDGTEITGSHKLTGDSLKRAVIEKLNTVARGGVSVPQDDKAPEKARLAVYVGLADLMFYGSGSDMKSIDLVALHEAKTKESSCGTYRNSRTKSVHTVKNYQYDREVILYERRAGRVKARKLFRAPPKSCPGTLTSADSLSSHVPQSKVQKFIEENM